MTKKRIHPNWRTAHYSTGISYTDWVYIIRDREGRYWWCFYEEQIIIDFWFEQEDDKYDKCAYELIANQVVRMFDKPSIEQILRKYFPENS